MVNPARRYGDQTAAQVHLGTSARINTGTSVNPQGPQKPRPEPYPPITPSVPVPPVLNDPGPQVSLVGEDVVLAMTVSQGSQPLSWSAINLPAGLSINDSTGVITGQSTQEENVNPTVTVTNAAGTHQVIFNWSTGYDPVIIDPGLQQPTVGQQTTLAMQVSQGTAGITWSETGLPAGLSIDSGTGVISGIPTTEGIVVSTVTATNGFGTDDQLVTWNVTDAVVSAATYPPSQPWADPITSTLVDVWFSNVNSSAGKRIRVERATSPQGPWTLVGFENQTINPTTYDVEVVSSNGQTVIKRQDDGEFSRDWFFSDTQTKGSLIAIEAGGDMAPAGRVRVDDISSDAKTLTIAVSGETPGNQSTISRIDWMGLTRQQYIQDTSAPANSILYYRLRTEDTDGANPTAWAMTPHWIKTPVDDLTPALPETFDHSLPSLSGTVHRPANAAALSALLQPASALSRGDIIELASPTWFEGTATFSSADNSINRPANSWIDNGFQVGQVITVEGSSGNNGLHTITELTALKMTCAGSTLSDETTDVEVWFSPYQDQHYYWQDLGVTNGDRDLDYVLIRGEDYAQLPASDERIATNERRYMPVLRSANNSITCFLGRDTVNGANEPGSYFYLQGIRLTRPGVAGNAQVPLIRLDSSATEMDNAIEYEDIGHHFVFDHCWLDGMDFDPETNSIRGMVANANYVCVKNSIFRRFRYNGADGQCILQNQSFGPLIVLNNELSGDGIAETIMMGGGGNRSAGSGSADVTIDHNWFTRAPSYDRRDPAFDFRPISKQEQWPVEVVSSSGTNSILKKADDSLFSASIYTRDQIQILSGGAITAGTYQVIDTKPDATQIMIDAPGETPGSQATLMRCVGAVVKNTIEVKQARGRLRITNNKLERCPIGAQRGFPFILSPKSEGLGIGDDGSPREFHWANACLDFYFGYNEIDNHDGDCVVQLTPQPEPGGGGPNTVAALGRRVQIEHNVYKNHSLTGQTAFVQVSVGTGETRSNGEFRGFTCRHNTTQVRPPDSRRIWRLDYCRDASAALASDSERPFMMTGECIGNLLACGTYTYTCFTGSSLATAEQVRANLTDTGVYGWRQNVWIDNQDSVLPSAIPSADFEAAGYDAVGWKDWQNGNFELDTGSPYKGIVSPEVTPGFSDAGADFVTLSAAIAEVESGRRTPPAPGNDFTNDTSAVCLWSLEDGAIDADSIGTNTLTNEGANVTADTVDFKEGAASGNYDRSLNSRQSITDGNLDPGFPMKSGETNNSLTLCFWVKFDELFMDGANYGIIDKFVASGNRKSFLIDHRNFGLRFVAGYAAGVSHENIEHAGTLQTGRWYHVAITYDNDGTDLGGLQRAYRIRIWDDTAGAILATDATGQVSGVLAITDAPIYVGRYNVGNDNDLGGRLDEVVWFNRALSTALTDQIRAGSYAETYP